MDEDKYFIDSKLNERLESTAKILAIILVVTCIFVFVIIWKPSSSMIDEKRINREEDCVLIRDIYSDFIWSKDEESFDINLHKAKIIANEYTDQLRNYKWGIALTGKIIANDPYKYIGIPIRISGVVTDYTTNTSNVFSPCVTGDMESKGARIRFILKSDGTDIFRTCTIIGTTIGLSEDDIPVVVGVVAK